MHVHCGGHPRKGLPGAGNGAAFRNNFKSIVARAGAWLGAQGLEVALRMARSLSEVDTALVAAAMKVETRPKWRTGGCRRIRALMTRSERVGSQKVVNRDAGG